MSIFEPNNSGTVSFVNGSKAIAGVGTTFKSYRAGSVISIPGLGEMQLAADPTSDTAAVGQVAWQAANTGARAFQYLPRNEQAIFTQKLTALLTDLGNGNIQGLSGLTLEANKLIKGAGPGTLATQDFPQWAQAMLALPGVANKLPYLTGANSAALTDLSTFMRTVLDDASAAAALETLGLSAFWRGRMGDADAAAARNGLQALGTGDYGLGTSGQNIADLRSSEVNVARFFRILPDATGGPGLYGGGVSLPVDGTPGTAFLATSGSRLFGGYKNGTGATPIWTEYLSRAAVLGTVSQSGGVPTGAIVERGSNANGDYVRFADGTQICFKSITATTDITQANGVLFISSSSTVLGSYAAAFASSPTVQVTTSDSAGGVILHVFQGTASVAPAVRCVWGRSVPSITQTFQLIAMGRWF